MSVEVLLFEIEPFVAMRVAQALLGAGYWITVATSLEQALAKLREPQAAFQVLVADLADGPPESAQRLLRAARERFPALQIVCACEPAGDARLAKALRRAGVLICDYSTDALMEMMLALRAGRACAARVRAPSGRRPLRRSA